MTLKKLTIFNSVNYIVQSEQTRCRDFKSNTMKNRKQNEKLSQNNKKNQESLYKSSRVWITYMNNEKF